MKKAKTLPKLKAECQLIFNEYIRKRDKDKLCISCSLPKTLHAGHYFPIQGYDGLRFNEHNVNGECPGCNVFDESHLIHYGMNLSDRIGGENYIKLLDAASEYKKNGYKFTRSELIEKIAYYKLKLKNHE